MSAFAGAMTRKELQDGDPTDNCTAARGPRSFACTFEDFTSSASPGRARLQMTLWRRKKQNRGCNSGDRNSNATARAPVSGAAPAEEIHVNSTAKDGC